MKSLIKNTFQFIQIIIVVLMILLSGSAMFVISSFLNDDHECCCCDKSTTQKAPETVQCDKECCTIVEAKEQPLDRSIPVSGNSAEKTFYLCGNCIHSGYGEISESSVIINPAASKHPKIYLITSVIRI